MKTGVFDSGFGGLSVAKAIQQALPKQEVIFVNDTIHVPYGTKKPAELLKLVKPILEGLVEQKCDVIVIACNTVTTTLIGKLRRHLSVPLVAIEPMVKPAAALTKSKIIAICATPTTLASQRYASLKEDYAKGIKVLEPDCSDWAAMIEHNRVDDQKIFEQINSVLSDGADVIVLACTHYHWIEGKINAMAAGRALVIQPESAIIAQLKKIVDQLQ